MRLLTFSSPPSPHRVLTNVPAQYCMEINQHSGSVVSGFSKALSAYVEWELTFALKGEKSGSLLEWVCWESYLLLN